MEIVNLIQRFKSLPVKSRNLLRFGVILGLVVALPLFVWGLIKFNFDIRNRAASGEPGVCVAQNKTVTVTPISDTNGTCHSIQAAVDAVTGDGYTIRIEPGTYDVASTININGKSNLTITGNEQAGSGAAVINRTNDWGILIQNSSGSIRWFTLQGGSSNGMLSIHNSNNFSVGYANLNSQSSHTLDIQGSSNVSVYNTEIQSSAGALEVDTSNGIHILNNKIHNSNNAISVNNSQNIEITGNLITTNDESGIRMQNITNLTVYHNTLYNNAKNGHIPAINIDGTIANGAFSNNIIAFNHGAGISFTGTSISATYSRNDVWSSLDGNYIGISNQTGTNGNISLDPLFNSANGTFCLQIGSPAIYGNIANGEYMGYIGPCASYPTPTATPRPGCGTTCQSSAGCSIGLTCYQPPMPICPPGTFCTQVMPPKICRNPSCPSRTDCICSTPTASPIPNISCKFEVYPGNTTLSQFNPGSTRPLDQNALRINAGDYYIYGVRFYNNTNNSISVSSFTVQHLHGVNEPINIVELDKSCMYNSSTKGVTCDPSDGSINTHSNALLNARLRVQILPRNSEDPKTSTMFSVQTSAGNVECANMLFYNRNIQVLTPNGGQNLTVGQHYTITWQASNINNYHLFLVNSLGQESLINGVNAPSTSYDWIVDSPIMANTANHKIKIVDATDSNTQDESDNYFAISTTPPTGKQTMSFLVNFGGVTDNSADGAKVVIRFKSNDGQVDKVTPAVPVQWSDVSNAYEATIELTSNFLPWDKDYSIYVKGEKHLSTKFCTQMGQSERCTGNGGIRLPDPQSNSRYIYSFSRLPLVPGDLPTQDGVANSSDYGKIQALLAKACDDQTDTDKITADLNYDKCVNIKDALLMRQTLETRYDEN